MATYEKNKKKLAQYQIKSMYVNVKDKYIANNIEGKDEEEKCSVYTY